MSSMISISLGNGEFALVQKPADMVGIAGADIFSQSATGQVSVLSALSALGPMSTLGNPGSDWHVVGVGAEGASEDVLLQSSSSGEVWEWQISNHAITVSEMLGNPGSEWRVAGAGNFDSSGLDVLMQSATTGQVWEWQTSTGQIASSQGLGSPGADWHLSGVSGDVATLQSAVTGQQWQWTIGANAQITSSGAV
jgi:hypothetical protein